MEITGAVNLAERFPDALPSEPDQDAFIKDVCTRMTDAFLAPVQLRDTTLTLIYSTVSLPSWTAGSRQVSCSIGATLGNGGWATLINSAKGPLLINGQPPIPPPAIPEERLNVPMPPMSFRQQPPAAPPAPVESAPPEPVEPAASMIETAPAPGPAPGPDPLVPVAAVPPVPAAS